MRTRVVRVGPRAYLHGRRRRVVASDGGVGHGGRRASDKR